MLSNRIFLVLLIFACLAFLPANSFAQGSTPKTVQTSDDSDGDGVKNSEDVCPNDKGTKANKGCPGENDDKELTPEQAKKQIEKLDSLKSNISFDPTPTPAPKAAPIRKKAPNMALSDCQFILDDNGCGKYFDKSASEISALFGKPLDGNNYPDLGLFFYIWGDRSHGVAETVAEVTFYGQASKYVKQFYGQPGESLSWKASRDDVVSQYGKPTEERSGIDSDKLPFNSLSYGENLRITIVNNEITEITIRFPKHNQDVEAYRERTAVEMEEFRKRNNEQWARYYREAEKERAAKEKAENAKKNPYNVSPEIQSAFDNVHHRVEYLTEQANKLVAKFNQNQYVYESLGWRYRKESEISALHIQAANLIREFLKDYNGKLPQSMIDHLNYDIEKLLLGNGH